MKIQPTGTNILLEIQDAREQGQVLLPESSKAILPYGLVITIGPDCKICKPGDKVLARFQLGQGVSATESERFLLISEGLIDAFYIDEVELTS